MGRAYTGLDESAWAGDDGALLGGRLPSDNRVTTLIGLGGAPVDQLAGRLAAAFERYGGSDEAGLREGFHARLEDRLRRQGGSRLPPLAELERALAERRGGEMATLLDARIRAWRDELSLVGDWIVDCETGADLLARVCARS